MDKPFDFSRPSPPEANDAKGKSANERPWNKKTDATDPPTTTEGDPTSGLKIAQGILLFVGVLSLGLNLYQLMNLDKEIHQARAGGARIDIDTDTIRVVRAVHIGAIYLGAFFVMLGLLVWEAPLPVTIAGFLLYVVGNIIFLSYTNGAGGDANYVKLFFALALMRAISDAAAYEREKRAGERKRKAPGQKQTSAQPKALNAIVADKPEVETDGAAVVEHPTPSSPHGPVWRVTGIDDASGKSVSREVSADSQDEAVAIAILDGLDVQSVAQVS